MSRRSTITLLIALVAVIIVGYALYQKVAAAAPSGVLELAGDVRADEDVVKAPAITYPVPDYTVGIPTTATAAPKKRAAGPSASRLPIVSGFLTDVLVAQGTHVSKGQPLAHLDTTLLDLGVDSASAALDRANANLAVLDKNLDKLATARSKLVTARAKLVTARASLAATIGVLLQTQASLETSIAAIQQLIAAFPPTGPPHIPPYPVLLAGMQSGLTQLKAGIAGAKVGLALMNAGLAKLSTGLSQLDSGRAQLVGVRKLAVINVGASRIALDLAKAARAQATIVAPADGVVTYARSAGTAVMVGAPIVRIRPDGAAHVVTYLTADQLAQVHIGTPATVTFDSNPGSPLTGHVSDLGSSAVVPPTGFVTSIVHMTRAVRVVIELDAGQTAPPGTPVDVEVTTGTTR